MKKLAIALMILAAAPAFAQEQSYTPLQRYLYDESGYAPPQLAAQPEAVPESNEPYSTAYAPTGAYYDSYDAPAESDSAADSSMPLMDF